MNSIGNCRLCKKPVLEDRGYVITNNGTWHQSCAVGVLEIYERGDVVGKRKRKKK